MCENTDEKQYVPVRFFAKYVNLYYPNWNFNSIEERQDFLKLFFRITNEYDRRFFKEDDWQSEFDRDVDLEKEFITYYCDELILLKGESIFEITAKVYEDCQRFALDHLLHWTQEKILEQCRQNPETPYSKLQMSIIEGDRGNYKKALSVIESFLENEPESIPFLAAAGDIYEKMGKNNKAISYYNIAYKLAVRNVGENINEHYTVESVLESGKEFIVLYRIRCKIALGDIESALKDAQNIAGVIPTSLLEYNKHTFGNITECVYENLKEREEEYRSQKFHSYNELIDILNNWRKLTGEYTSLITKGY